VANGLTIDEFDLYVDAASYAGLVSDYNLFWNPGSQDPIKANGVRYATVAAWSAASGQDAHTRFADPRFASPALGDFHLLALSPAIDAANSGTADWPTLDADGRPRVNIPGVADTGTGPVSYADIGAFEFGDALLAVTDRSPAPGPGIAPPTPNPSHGPVTFTIVAARSGTLEWSVFDPQGRRWCAGARETAAGVCRVAWDGRGEDGRTAPAGIYLVRAALDGGVSCRRFVRMR
jgi:hypothetical protein